ncbi:uncharacterized protein TNCV_4182011 [Trichonephila clavipes]|nr:uncharacterized protein TNCV_4182011 [Trichonephila clavipes]
MDAEVHEQMSRFGGLSEERPSVFKTRSKLGTHLSTQCSGDERQSRPCAAPEWYRYRNVACFVTSSRPVPLKTRRVGQRCTLNQSRAETSSRWCGVVVRRRGASSGVVHVT